MSPLQSFACDFHDFHGKRFAVVTKTYWNHPKPAKTSQNHPKPAKTTQNHANPAKTTQIHAQYALSRPVCAILA